MDFLFSLTHGLHELSSNEIDHQFKKVPNPYAKGWSALQDQSPNKKGKLELFVPPEGSIHFHDLD